jgi:predicted outer membrane repeat protein
VRYVTTATTLPEDGLTWASAYTDPNPAITDAAFMASLDSEITFCDVWVQEGTYYVYQDSLDNTVLLLAGAQVYGGFVGDETERAQRDWVSNVTTLDGSDALDNNQVCHVVTGADSAVIDGFTITDGSATGSSTDCDNGDRGGGMINDGVSPTIDHCFFTGNAATEHGAAIANIGAAPTILNTRFTANTAGQLGGAIFSQSSSDPTLQSCVFRINDAGSGGGLASNNSDATLANCTFYNNTAATSGHSVYASAGGNVTITNSILWGPSSGQTADDGIALINYTYSDVVGAAAVMGNIDQDPQFVAPTNPRLSSGSPCIDAADTTVAPAFDLDGYPRVDDPLTANTGVGFAGQWADMGAFEFQP